RRHRGGERAGPGHPLPPRLPARPEEALALLDEAPFDVVVTDLSMPEMSGRELAAHVRRRCPDLPIVLLTGDTDAQEDVEHLDAVVQKPFKLDALEATIQRVLRKD